MACRANSLVFLIDHGVIVPLIERRETISNLALSCKLLHTSTVQWLLELTWDHYVKILRNRLQNESATESLQIPAPVMNALMQHFKHRAVTDRHELLGIARRILSADSSAACLTETAMADLLDVCQLMGRLSTEGLNSHSVHASFWLCASCCLQLSSMEAGQTHRMTELHQWVVSCCNDFPCLGIDPRERRFGSPTGPPEPHWTGWYWPDTDPDLVFKWPTADSAEQHTEPALSILLDTRRQLSSHAAERISAHIWQTPLTFDDAEEAVAWVCTAMKSASQHEAGTAEYDGETLDDRRPSQVRSAEWMDLGWHITRVLKGLSRLAKHCNRDVNEISPLALADCAAGGEASSLLDVDSMRSHVQMLHAWRSETTEKRSIKATLSSVRRPLQMLTMVCSVCFTVLLYCQVEGYSGFSQFTSWSPLWLASALWLSYFCWFYHLHWQLRKPTNDWWTALALDDSPFFTSSRRFSIFGRDLTRIMASHWPVLPLEFIGLFVVLSGMSCVHSSIGWLAVFLIFGFCVLLSCVGVASIATCRGWPLLSFLPVGCLSIMLIFPFLRLALDDDFPLAAGLIPVWFILVTMFSLMIQALVGRDRKTWFVCVFVLCYLLCLAVPILWSLKVDGDYAIPWAVVFGVVGSLEMIVFSILTAVLFCGLKFR